MVRQNSVRLRFQHRQPGWYTVSPAEKCFSPSQTGFLGFRGKGSRTNKYQASLSDWSRIEFLRTHGELLKLGIDVGESSVSKYMVRSPKPPSQTWRTFLENDAKQLVSIDFFTVPTIRFQVLYVFLMLAHDRRLILHFNVTAHPTADWTAQQAREAFPFAQLPRFLLRDRDAIFGNDFREPAAPSRRTPLVAPESLVAPGESFSNERCVLDR